LEESLFQSVTLNDFTASEIEDYATRWFKQMQRGDLLVSFLSESQSVQDLTNNPLMLSLLCSLFRAHGAIPRNRRSVYRKCADLLFHQWDSRRQITQNEDLPDFGNRLMEEIARLFHGSQAARAGVEEGQLVKIVAVHLRDYAGVPDGAATRRAQEFLDFCAGRAWLLGRIGSPAGVPLYNFTHRTFYEFFAAEALVRRSDTPDEVAQHIIQASSDDETSVLPELLIQAFEEKSERGATRVFERVCGRGPDPALLLRLMNTSLRRETRDMGFRAVVQHWDVVNPPVDLAMFSALLMLHPDPRDQFMQDYLQAEAPLGRVVRRGYLEGWASLSMTGHLAFLGKFWPEAITETVRRVVAEGENSPRMVITTNWLITQGECEPDTLGLGEIMLVRPFGEPTYGAAFQALLPAEGIFGIAQAQNTMVRDTMAEYLERQWEIGGVLSFELARKIGVNLEQVDFPGSMAFPIDRTSVIAAAVGLALLMAEVKRPSEALESFLSAYSGPDIRAMADVRNWKIGSSTKPSDDVGRRAVESLNDLPMWCRAWTNATHHMTFAS